jgi:hypothetical protein
MIAMKRVKDGALLPYSPTLVAAAPGAYVAMRFDIKTRKWTEKDGVPLVAPPAPAAAPGEIPDDLDDEEPQAAFHDPEPETLDGEDSPEDAQRPKRRRKGA